MHCYLGMWHCFPWLCVPSFLPLFDEKSFKHPLRYHDHRYLLCFCFVSGIKSKLPCMTVPFVRCTFTFPTSESLLSLLRNHTHTLSHNHTHIFQFAVPSRTLPQMKGGPLSFNNRIWWIPSLLHVEKISPFALLASSIQNSTWLNPISTVI